MVFMRLLVRLENYTYHILCFPCTAIRHPLEVTYQKMLFSLFPWRKYETMDPCFNLVCSVESVCMDTSWAKLSGNYLDVNTR